MMGPHTGDPLDLCVRNLFGLHAGAGGEGDTNAARETEETSRRAVVRRTTPEDQA
jgi:hypothetical protein